ncbi:MAG: YjbE family putative metal transport protein [Alphaproteobacteria bacterium]|nr:YjbE family putative metal transport protein [Alphaproteobacteria bacterium]
MEILTLEGLQAFLTVVLIDLVLAGDNAVVIGMAAAGLDKVHRGRAILIGVLIATLLRIVFALIATRLLSVIGLLFAGGILLLWVCWKMWRELRSEDLHQQAHEAATEAGEPPPEKRVKSLHQAVIQIVLADVSMSLDNVLAVAGAAHKHPLIMVFGLMLSVLLMGAAASLIARLLHRHRWIAYAGLLIIVYVAGHMMWDGGRQIYECNPSWHGEQEFGPNCPLAPGHGTPDPSAG